MTMEPLAARRRLTEEVAEQIRQEILNRRLRQDERLVESHIAAQLGVSRGPVREAFKLLAAQGLLVDKPNRGTYVASFSSGDVREVFEVRIAIETRAAKLLTQTASDRGGRELRDLVTRLGEAAHEHDARSIAQIDLAFHEAICRLSGVQRLHELFVQHVPTLQALVSIDEFFYASPEDILTEHERILAAIEARDGPAAAMLIEEHLEVSRDRVAAYIDSPSPRGK